jgi:hypothetical protein
MAIQIRANQIADSQIGAAKLDLSSGTFDFSSATITVATPSADGQAASKSYVDSVAAGLDLKDSCRVATTANITLSGTQTIDGVAVSADQRVLVKNQSTASENGIYLCKAGSWARSSDLAAGDDAAGVFTFIEEGTSNGDKGFVCTSNSGSAVVGTNNLSFSQFSDTGTITAGDGLQKVGSEISANLDGSTLAASASGLKVADLGIANGQISNSAAIAVSKLAASTISGVTLGGNLAALTPATNGGVLFSSYNGSSAVSNLQLDVSDLADAAVNVAADSIAIYDADADVTGKESIADLMAAVAGTALSAASGQLSVSGVGNAQIAADAAIAVSKLAASTISGVTLGGNLASLSPATNGGILFSAYNGSAAVNNLQLDVSDLADAAVNVGADSIAIYDADADATGKESIADLATAMAGNGISASSGVFAAQNDGSTISVSASGIKVADNGITSTQINNAAVSVAKLSFQSRQDVFSPNGSTLAFNLVNEVASAMDNFVMVFRNGLLQKKVSSSPADESEYTVSTTGGTTTVTFGANLSSSDALEVRYLA